MVSTGTSRIVEQERTDVASPLISSGPAMPTLPRIINYNRGARSTLSISSSLFFRYLSLSFSFYDYSFCLLISRWAALYCPRALASRCRAVSIETHLHRGEERGTTGI